MPNISGKLLVDQQNAKHGEFFFAKFITNDGRLRRSPVFVLSNKEDRNQDVIVCSCTSHPPRTNYDISVGLQKETSVRTNKIYTIKRDNLLFKIPQTPNPQEYDTIISKVKEALQINATVTVG